jgi:hypothetical protein
VQGTPDNQTSRGPLAGQLAVALTGRLKLRQGGLIKRRKDKGIWFGVALTPQFTHGVPHVVGWWDKLEVAKKRDRALTKTRPQGSGPRKV